MIYRELFPSGLTLLDKGQLGELGTSHLVARQELRELVAGLKLPRIAPASRRSHWRRLLQIMIVRLLFFAVAISIGCKVALGRWPWDFLQPGADPLASSVPARKLLAVRAAARRPRRKSSTRIASCSPWSIPTAAAPIRQVHDANAARDLLLDELPDGN